MIDYVIFDNAGLIVQTGSVPDDMVQLQGDPENARFVVAGTAGMDTHYVLDGIIVERPDMPARVSRSAVQADGVEQAVIVGAPAGATVFVTGPSNMTGEADGSDIALTFAIAGSYTISISLFPYKHMEATVNAF